MTTANEERLVREINVEHELAQASLRTSLSHAVRVGKLLIESRESIPRGHWTKWVEGNCSFSVRMAQNYVRLAQKGTEFESEEKSPTPTSIRGALKALSTHSSDQSVHFSSASPDWHTPHAVVERVVGVLKHIDLDPCSNARSLGMEEDCSSCGRTGEDRHLCGCGEILCESCYDRSHQRHDDGKAHERSANVPAAQHFIRADNGLDREWHGRVFMNPPYGREIGRWTSKLRRSYEAEGVVEAIALVPARTDASWFADLRDYPRCFLRGRLKFGDAKNSAPFPSTVIYLGSDVEAFHDRFRDAGDLFVRHVPTASQR